MPKKGPIGTFLFCGPSGTWKTEMVRSIAEILLWSKDRFTKINCESLSESHSWSSLFGAPPSYIWYGKEAMLWKHIYQHYDIAQKEWSVSAMVRRFPNFNIVLFDEIEKAHPKVHQSLLSILDDWVLRMADGDTVDMSSSLIIMTSNVGEREAREIKSKPSFWFVKQDFSSDLDKSFNDSLKMFSPEFLWRITKTVRFKQLTEDNCRDILRSKVDELNWFLHQVSDLDWSTKISIKLWKKVEDFLMEEWFSKEKWARDIDRVFQKHINAWLWEIIASNPDIMNFPRHKAEIFIDMHKWELRFSIFARSVSEIQSDIRKLTDLRLRG